MVTASLKNDEEINKKVEEDIMKEKRIERLKKGPKSEIEFKPK